MFGHQHSHNRPDNMHGHNRADMQAAMQRAFQAMRAANNGNMPALPPNMPPHLMQEFLKNQMLAMQNNPQMSFTPPIPLPFNTNNTAQNKSGNNVIDKEELDTAHNDLVDDDYSKFDIVKATQYGAFDRCKELYDSGVVDVNRPDNENVYLLHWAAINNRTEIAKYYIEKGATVDVIGGELQSTPLHWATRQGHIQMVILLINAGADPLLFDNEGFSTIHLATMFGHSIIVAYLLAKGIDPDFRDKNNVTPLMFAAQRIHNRDPAQLLITFDARINTQDVKGNTPLHYCVQYSNSVVMRVLLDKGASLDIKNNSGLDPLEFATEKKKTNTVYMLHSYLVDDKNNLPNILKPISANKNIRKLMTQIFPFLTLFYFGMLFDTPLWIFYKILIAGLFYFIFFGFKFLFFDKYTNKYIPIATTMAFIFWLYTTWFIYFRPIVFSHSLYIASFAIATAFSWYNFYKAWKTNPGILNNNRSEINKSLLQFIERNDFNLDQFCTSCVVRKPIRSKHCAECDHCVSKFDHHCPWVDNCIGEFNLKYFIGFLFWTPICLAFFMDGAIEYFKSECLTAADTTTFQIIAQAFLCTPWVTFFTFVAGFNIFWISCLFICHIYQAGLAAMTTNERMNVFRYKHFQDANGKFQNPFNFGIIQNLVDVFNINFGPFKPSQIIWLNTFDVDELTKIKGNRRIKNSFSNV